MVQYQQMIEEPIVILGGGGFIGSNLAEALSARGYTDVTQVDKEFHSWRWTGKKRWADLRNWHETYEVVAGARTVFHLAADMGGVEYFHSDRDFHASLNNARITANVLQACGMSEDRKRVIYTSSACAADISKQFTPYPYPIREVDITRGNPDARYGIEKRNGAYMVAQAPFDGRVALLHTVYGPGQEFVGNRRKFPSAVVTNSIDAVRNGTPLTLFGDGQQKRTYLYIADAVDRIIQLAEIPEGWLVDDEVTQHWSYEYPWLNRVFNIGSDQVVTCEQVARFALNLATGRVQYVPSHNHRPLFDPLPDIVYDGSKPSGVLARACDLTKWHDLFGPIDETHWMEGFEHFYDWVVEVRDSLDSHEFVG